MCICSILLNADTPNWVEITGLMVGGLGLVFGLYQFYDSIRQRKREFRWKKAETAIGMIDEIFDYEYSWNALRMLDYPEGTFYCEEKELKLTKELLSNAMKNLDNPDDSNLLEQYKFIRESFEALFYYLNRLEHGVNIGLIDIHDLKDPLKYYSGLLCRHEKLLKNYMDAIGYGSSFAFLRRIEGLYAPKR